jgi:carbamoyl-phosphate synthase large subunit
MLKILFTGGGGAGSEALFRLLQKKYSVHFADADLDAIDPGIPAGHRHKLPWASDCEFVSNTAKLCHQLSIDILIPGVDEELNYLASHSDAFGATRLLLPSPDYITTMLDKLSMARALDSKNLQVPHTHQLTETWDGLDFPCILKPRRGRGSRGVRTLLNLSEALLLRDTLGPSANDYIIQEKAVGQEYTVQMLASSDRILHAIVPVKVEIKRGVTLRAETCADPRVLEACRAIHKALPASGCYNIQLILTDDGKVLPFEINPRVSTTLCLVVAAGVDPIDIFNSTEIDEDRLLKYFETGLRLQRHWTNHFFQL